jgi:hypothetical protein
MAASLDALDPDLRAAALSLDDAVHSSGLQGRFTSTLRTHAEQARLYRRWLHGLSPLPAAPPGQSAHEYGLAFDYLVIPNEYTRDVADYAIRELGLAWKAADPVHYEIPGASAWAASQSTDAEVETTYSKVATTVVGMALPAPISIAASIGSAIEGKPLLVEAGPAEPEITDSVSFGAWLAWKMKQWFK